MKEVTAMPQTLSLKRSHLASALLASGLALGLGLVTTATVQAQPQPAVAKLMPAAQPKAKRPAQSSFAVPEKALQALVDAVESADRDLLLAVLGQGAGRVIDSGDPQTDTRTKASFLTAYRQSHSIEFEGSQRARVLLGDANWPLPFPLVKEAERWRFDTQAGLTQHLDRQVGANELSVIAVLDSYVQAQVEYARKDHSRNGLLEYAQRIVSSTGQRDGLYWDAAEGEALSPMGARFALASLGHMRGTDEAPQPFEGYFYRPLTSQGPHARGGAYDYLVKGHQIGGFALLATPARYGVSGIMTFMVNHDGVVFSKNLGPKTKVLAERVKGFNPDASWLRETALAAPAAANLQTAEPRGLATK